MCRIHHRRRRHHHQRRFQLQLLFLHHLLCFRRRYCHYHHHHHFVVIFLFFVVIFIITITITVTIVIIIIVIVFMTRSRLTCINSGSSVGTPSSPPPHVRGTCTHVRGTSAVFKCSYIDSPCRLRVLYCFVSCSYLHYEFKFLTSVSLSCQTPGVTRSVL